jgi:branched-chain amino acid transport system permease protein
MEGLRSVLQQVSISQEWRLVVAPLMLILLMIFRPYGIMGLREFRFLIPPEERPEALAEQREQAQAAKRAKEVVP